MLKINQLVVQILWQEVRDLLSGRVGIFKNKYVWKGKWNIFITNCSPIWNWEKFEAQRFDSVWVGGGSSSKVFEREKGEKSHRENYSYSLRDFSDEETPTCVFILQIVSNKGSWCFPWQMACPSLPCLGEQLQVASNQVSYPGKRLELGK